MGLYNHIIYLGGRLIWLQVIEISRKFECEQDETIYDISMLIKISLKNPAGSAI